MTWFDGFTIFVGLFCLYNWVIACICVWKMWFETLDTNAMYAMKFVEVATLSTIAFALVYYVTLHD